MRADHEAAGGWPRWVKVVFAISGYIFIFTVIIELNHLEDPFLAFRDIVWTVTISEYLAIIVILQCIGLTLRQGRNWRTIMLSVFYGLIGLLLMFGVSALSERLIFETSAAYSFTIELITTITGLIAALTALYGQIITGRKVAGELELEKQRLELERAKLNLKARKKLAAKKK